MTSSRTPRSTESSSWPPPGTPDRQDREYPAQNKEVLGVASSSSDGTALSEFSNWGDWVAVASPAERVLGPMPGGRVRLVGRHVGGGPPGQWTGRSVAGPWPRRQRHGGGHHQEHPQARGRQGARTQDQEREHRPVGQPDAQQGQVTREDPGPGVRSPARVGRRRRALMECVIGLSTTEGVRTTLLHDGPSTTLVDVESATAGCGRGRGQATP